MPPVEVTGISGLSKIGNTDTMIQRETAIPQQIIF
jgi:hypothetical protein